MPQINKAEYGRNITQLSHTNAAMYNASTTAYKVARRAGVATTSHAKSISEESDKTVEQEAIDKLESYGRITISEAANTALETKDSIRRQIKKKSPDIKNTKDINRGTRTINKANRTLKTASDTSRLAVKSTTEASKQAAIASQKVATAKKAEQQAKKAAEWVKKIVKGIIEGIKELGTSLGAASIPLMLILVLAASIAALAASAFGIFFAGDSVNTTTRPLKEVVMEINAEYTDKIEGIKNSSPHDELVTEGYQASWPDILSVYAVYVTTKTDGATDVVSISDDHIKTLQDIFWQMNSITSSTKKITETKKVPDLDANGNQKKDKEGNLLYKEEKATKTILTITINHKTALQEASTLHFNTQQIAQLNELLNVSNASLWAEILRGVGLGSNELVNLALSQLGNKGGEKYWRWAGLSSRCEWCAIFVSWCGDKTGLRAAGQIPYFSFVSDGVSFYKKKGKWIDGSEINTSNCDKLVYPGMIIFFDWEPDGKPNHVGIVTKVENGYIYTVEGNKSDAVAEGCYSADSQKLFGFGFI